MGNDKKVTKVSHSALQVLNECGQKYKYRYVDRLYSRTVGSALPFGSAFDKAIDACMMNTEDPIEVFDKYWLRGFINGELVDLKTSNLVEYLAGDPDLDLLTKEDFEELNSDIIYAAGVLDDVKSGNTLSAEALSLYYAICWTSLRRKGHIMIETFIREIKPRVKRVLASQYKIEMFNEEGDSSVGYIDFIVELDDSRIAVIDVKTASMDYAWDSVRTSTQLAGYIFQVENTFNTRLGGYAVVSKKLVKTKTKTCTVCGHVATGSHRTCDATLGGKRCGGGWDEVVEISGRSQFLLDEIPQQTENIVIDNYNQSAKLIKAEIFTRNFNACINRYGKKCEFYSKCYNNQDTNLIHVPKKENKDG